MQLPNFLKRGITRWLELSPQERLFVLIMTVQLPTVWVGLRTMGTNRMLGWVLATRRSTHANSHWRLDHTRKCWELTRTTARYCLPQGSCLPQALVLFRWLCKHGLEPELKIGARRGDNVLEAHAWLELDGIPLDSTSNDYRLLFSSTMHLGSQLNDISLKG